MNTLLAGIAALGVVGLVHAHPLVIEESSRIPTPPGVEGLYGDLALDGNEAVALSFYSYLAEDGYDYWTIVSAHLFRRTGTTWTYVRKLAESDDSSADDATNHNPIAMKNGVLALAFEPMYIFEREGGNWVPKQIGAPPGQPVAWHEPVSDVDIDGGRIFIGSESWGGSIYEKDSTTGNWMNRATLRGDYSGDSDNSVGGDVDVSPNWAVVSSQYNYDELQAPAMHVFQRTGTTTWPLHARLVAEPGHTFGDVAIRDDALIIGDFSRFGAGVWRRNSSNEWYRADNLRTVSDFTIQGPYSGYGELNALVKSDQYVFQSRWNVDRGARVINVFQQDVNGYYRHVAILAAKDGHDIGTVSASGRGVLVNSQTGPLYFELPESFAQPELFQDTFATGNGLGWTSLPGSQLSVVQSGNSRVFRQASTAGDAGAVLDAHDWTNQSIQAEVKPTAINGNDRWVGLATRRTDASNFYYVTLRSSGIIQLKRNQGGVLATLDSASVPWALNRTYRLRLESVGTLHRVYVDGDLVLEAWDDALSHGRAALLSYRAAAEYDNVIVSPFVTQTIYTAREGDVGTTPLLQPEPWAYSGTGQWSWQHEGTTGDAQFRQTSTAGDARAAIGPEEVVNTDQIVQARARPRAFNPASDSWFGVMARYRDASNYVYMSLRRSNTVTLRKVQNGNIIQLGSAVLTVTPNTWYSLRLEAVGSRLRAYVNGRLVLEATDTQPVTGRVGLVGYRAAADYDDIRAVVP